MTKQKDPAHWCDCQIWNEEFICLNLEYEHLNYCPYCGKNWLRRAKMVEWLISFIFIGTVIGGIGIGYMWAYKETAFWRIQWIRLEHDLARLQKREPRDIKAMKNE